MTSGELYELFRSDVDDVEAPYLWTDTEVYAYMNDAYRQFVRLTGGVADATSALTTIDVVAGEAFSDVSPLILRFRQAYLVSSGSDVVITNQEDIMKFKRADYGQANIVVNDMTAGPVRYMVIGQERNKVRWMQVPTANDAVQLSVYRLPLDTIENGNDSFTFNDIGQEHVEFLLLWMKARAYGKQDTETFNRGNRDSYKAEFEQYCKAATAEWERYKHKTRVVAYGGI